VESVVLPKLGSVRLRGIVGGPVYADLVKVHISLFDPTGGMSSSVPVVCAVCPGLNENMILTSALVSQLQSVSMNDAAQCDSGVNVEDMHDCIEVVDGVNNEQISCIGVIHGNVSPIENDTSDISDQVVGNDGNLVSDIENFKEEQVNDESLKPCWDMARKANGGFTIYNVFHNGLLHHTEHSMCR